MANPLNSQALNSLLLKVYEFIKPFIFPAVLMAYIAGEAYTVAYNKFYIYAYIALPAVLFIIYLAIFHLQYLLFFLAFCTPLAISLKEMHLTKGPDLSIPTEPVMAGILFVYILNTLYKPFTDKKFLQHGMSYLIYLQILWMIVTTASSTDVVVSVKYVISRLWFVVSCYMIVPHLFKNKNNILGFMFAYAVALVIVVCYTIIMHAGYNFNDKAADWVVSPFYNDHTAYGAALAMFIPVMLGLVFMKSVPKYLKVISFSMFLLFFVAIILSFARAGWLSLAVIILMLITIFFKIKFRTLVVTLSTVVILFFVFQTEILMALGKNSQDSKGGFEENLQSVSNISTDASNRERLNRWSCAYRMWQDKPLLGWGPGTYMFKYAPYQLSQHWTIISTNLGDNGNAHSEYLGPLAEQGLPGLLIMLFMLFYTCSLGYRLVYSLKERDDRILCLSVFLGLMTYFIHGFLNNFLDTDKLSLPFWGFMGTLVCFDLYYAKKESTRRSELPPNDVNTLTP